MTKSRFFVTFGLLYVLVIAVFSVSAGELEDQLFAVSKSGDTKQIKALLSKGADINLPDENGLTPLIVAASEGKFDAVKLLLENEADIDQEERNGVTALMVASAQGHPKIVQLLLDNDAYVDVISSNGPQL